ncbi:MAG: phage baseplate assembly protein V [Rhodobacteraceae bacterium]|nr:phage baseplate assembly protein V [Paracoccaceae bacterium]
MSRALAETDRRLGNLVQLGRVVSIDTGTMRVRVRIGELQTHEIPVAQLASGAIRFHWMPSPGEQVVVFAPSGDLARAFVQGAVPQSGGAVAPDAGTPTIDLGGGTLSVVGNLIVDGDITATGDVTASGVSLVTHTHQGVTPGGGSTGEPNA